MFSKAPILILKGFTGWNDSLFITLSVISLTFYSDYSCSELVYSNDLTTTIEGNMLIPADKGTTHGANLFHSFETFNVQTGESATFTGPDAIANVIAKVNGATGTLIDGLLKSDISQANLFLINPNGIIVGSEGAIDVDGSLYFSTADTLMFADGSRLFVSESGNSILTSAAPVAFGFLSSNVAPIRLENAVISNKEGSGISLIGGDITFHNASIYVPDGSIDVVSLAGTAEVSLSPEFRSPAAIDSLGNISVLNTGSGEITKISKMFEQYGQRVADLDVSGSEGGRIDLLSDRLSIERGFVFADTQAMGRGQGIAVHTRSLMELAGGSRITTDSLGDGPAGNIELISGNSINLSGASTISSDARGLMGDAGKIVITTKKLVVGSLSQIKTTTNGEGDGGEIQIHATTVDLISGGSVAGQTIGGGKGGDIRIIAFESLLFDGTDVERNIDSGVSVSTLGAGDAGSIQLETSLLQLKNGASIKAFSGGQSEVAGAAGSITILADLLDISEGSSIDASSYSSANAGNIEFSGLVLNIDGQEAGILSETIGSGNGGSIIIQTDSLRLTGSSTLTVSSSSSGNAGSVFIDAVEVEIVSAKLEAGTSSSGQGGVVMITTNEMTMAQGGIIRTGTGGTGDAGSVTLDISSTLLMTGSGTSISSRSGFGADGQFGSGGTLDVRANKIDIGQQASIEATSSGTGFAGDLSIFVTTNLDLSDGAAFKTNALNSGGGNIDVQVVEQIYLSNSTVTASAGGVNATDNSGNVTIDPIFLILKNSSILAQANFGDGGAIFLSADNFIRDVSSVIDASSQRGNDGEITIASPDLDITGVLGVLNTSFIVDQTMLKESCAALAFDDQSSLVVIPGKFRSRTPTGYSTDGTSAAGRGGCAQP